jgi:Mrp family chromosome partitioning ATPase
MSTNQHVGKIINQAYTPGICIAPRKSVILFIALCLAGLISLAYIFIEYTLKTTIENRKQLESLTSIPVISNISIPKNYNSTTDNTTNETLSLLRNNLIINTKNKSQTILITSTNKDNVRSIVATNLAFSFSATKEKIALVNFDTKESKLDKYIQSNNILGISDYLNDLSIKEENIAYKCNENPFVNIFTIGTTFNNLPDLLINSRLNTLFDYLKQNYKYIIINSYPIDANCNLITLNQFTDLTLFICQQNTTEKTDIKQLNYLSETNNFNNIALIYSTEC